MSIGRCTVWLILVMVTLMPTMSLACFAPPAYLSEPHHELVMKSTAIVLAKVVDTRDSTLDGYATFVFDPVETLKGSPPENLEIYGMKAGWLAARPNRPEGSDFDGHRSPEFWAWSLGNTSMDTACNVYGVFKVGQKYLLFLRDKPHFRAYENIREDDDLWLAVVRLVAENFGDGMLEDFAGLPQADNSTQCIERVVADKTFQYVRHMAIDACIERHSDD